MNFSRELRDDAISGDITVSFRLWQRPQVRVGGRYPVGSPARHPVQLPCQHEGAIVHELVLLTIQDDPAPVLDGLDLTASHPGHRGRARAHSASVNVS